LTDFVDPYCWPGSSVLRNLLELKTQVELTEAEYAFTLERRLELQEHPIDGDYDLAHLCAIHHHLFQDIFEWAGQTRTVEMSKDTSKFLPPSRFPLAAGHIFDTLRRGPLLTGRPMSDEVFINTAAGLLDEINYMHPFREGNGRTQRAFLDLIAGVGGRKLTWRNVPQLENNAASAQAVRTGRPTALREMLAKVVRPPVDGAAGFDLEAYRVTPSTTADEEPTAMLCRGGCGRALTAPRSIARGFGASCWKKRNG
jgi:cell filamentation protein